MSASLKLEQASHWSGADPTDILQQLKLKLRDWLFSLTTNSEIIVEQASLSCRDLCQVLSRQRDFLHATRCDVQANELFAEVVARLVELSRYHVSVSVPANEQRALCLRQLREMFGFESLLLSDLYYLFAIQLERIDALDEAIDFAGRSLFIRLKCCGTINLRVAESHFQLGAFYFKKEFDNEARKELSAARIVFSKLDENFSHMIANCWLLVAQSDFRCWNYVQAFSSLLKCYRLRHFALGPEDPLTFATRQLLEVYRTSGNGCFIGGVELKDRVDHLQWLRHPQLAPTHVVGLFVQRLNDEHILSLDQLDSLVAAALSYQEKLLSQHKTSRVSWEAQSKDELLAVLVQPSAPLMTREHTLSAGFSNKEISPREPLSARAPPQLSVSLSQESSEDVSEPSSPTELVPTVNNNSERDSNNSPVTPCKAPTQSEVSLAITPCKGSVTVGVESESEERKHSQPSAPPATTTHATTAMTTANPTATATVNEERPVVKRTWRPISIHSPLRIAATGGLSLLSQLDLQGKSYRLVRAEQGGIVFVRKCSAEFLRRAFRAKVLAFGLLAWYAAGNSLSVKKTNSAHSDGAANSSIGAKEAGKQEVGADKSDAKNALNAMFGKRLGGPPPPAPPKNTSAAAAAEEKGQAPTFAEAPPRPPPLPTCWPPVPYTGAESASAGDGNASATDAKEAETDANQGPPKPKLKQVFLASLASIEGTFWAEPQENLVSPDELFDDLEEEFAAVKKKPVAFGGKNAKPVPGKSEKAARPVAESVLDAQRAQNINIMLAKFGKKSMESVAESVVNMEAVALGASAITALSQFIPTADEIARVSKFVSEKNAKSADSDKTSSDAAAAITTTRLAELKIGKAEQYIFFMAKVKKMEKRLSAMSSILCANELSSSIISQSEVLLNAVSEVMGSGRLKFLLKTCLELNNRLVQYAKNGSVMNGITIASWNKLAQVKLNNGDTVQQYVVNKVMVHIPEALELSNDLPTVDEAKSVQMNRLSSDVRKLEEASALLNELLTDDTEENKDEPEPSVSMKNLSNHQEEIKKQLGASKERFELAQKEFVQCCTYYGESSPPAEPETFFGELSGLCKSVQAAVKIASEKQRKKGLSPK